LKRRTTKIGGATIPPGRDSSRYQGFGSFVASAYIFMCSGFANWAPPEIDLPM